MENSYFINAKKENREQLVIIFQIGDDDHKSATIADYNEFISMSEVKTEFEKVIDFIDNYAISYLEIFEEKQYNSKVVGLVERKIRGKRVNKLTKEIWETGMYSKEIVYYFRILISSDNRDEIVNSVFIPLSMIRQKHIKNWKQNEVENKKILVDITSDQNGDYFRISNIMAIESLFDQHYWQTENGKVKFGTLSLTEPDKINKKIINELHNQCFFYRKQSGIWRADRLKINGIGVFHKYIPIIRLNRYSYSILGSSVNEYFEGGFNSLSINENLIDSINSKISPIIKQIYFSNEEKIEYEKILVQTLILRTCIALLNTSSSLKNSSLNLYELCSHMSILSFFLMLVYCNFVKDELQEDEIISLIHISDDYSDGILQIIENAVEYAKELAYFSIRIKYVKSKEQNFVNPEMFYLEINISDLSSFTIPQKFFENVERRQKNGGASSSIKIDDLELIDFFNPDLKKRKIWNKYYENIENLTHHFGIQQFVSSVAVGNGYFRVISSQSIIPNDEEIYIENFPKKEALEENIANNAHIPGTEYLIRLPIEISKTGIDQIPVGIGVELNYDDPIVNQSVYFISITDLLDEYTKITTILSQDDKETNIKIIREKINKHLENLENNSTKKQNGITICFDVNEITQSKSDKQILIDIFSKALIQYIINQVNSISIRIAIINASRIFIINFTRIFATFCSNIEDIQSVKYKLGDTQIYICDQEMDTEMVFFGGELSAAYKCSEYMASRKGVYPESENIIREILQRKNTFLSKSVAGYQISPFEICITENENSPVTLFEKRTKIELSRDIQKKVLGCSLSNSHMRVGSKIHISDKFFDATLLLASSYYTKRFSYLLSKQIFGKLKNDNNESITLIGYEDYSEMLILEIQKCLLTKFNYESVEFSIFGQDNKPIFKFENSIKNDRHYFIIVPVNSTLTTHDKIAAALLRKINEANLNKKTISIHNLAIILIRDNKSVISNDAEITELESRFWVKFDFDTRSVITKFSTKKDIRNSTQQKQVFYNILLTSEWENPLSCTGCFPEIEIINEKPMLEVSKSSVMSMVLAGLIEEYPSNIGYTISEAPGKIDDLEDVLLYGHLYHSGNHHQYFFQTEKLMQNLYKNENALYENWKKSLSEEIQNYRNEKESHGVTVYDIIVAPIHSTNGTFVEDINSSVFNSVPIIIYIDPSREFRESIKAKYSNLTGLFWNNFNAKRNAEINFYFVDDTITSGKSIRRTESLIHSLFPDIAFDIDALVKVNVFRKVIILLNRCSMDSINDYISRNDFHRYYHLYIPSIRNHKGDTCILCDIERKYNTIISCCSTNEMASWWNKKKNTFQLKNFDSYYKSIEKSYPNIQNDSGEIKRRHFRRLFCANQFAFDLHSLSSSERNNSDKIRDCILNLLKQSQSNSEIETIEYYISYIKVISRISFSSRKSTFEAIFKLLLEIVEVFISVFLESGDEKDTYTDILFIYNLFHDIKTKYFSKKQLTLEGALIIPEIQSLFHCIIAQLSSLGSKYLLRKQNILRIMACADSILINHGEFEEFFLANIKRVVTLNRDETIELWLEFLLWTGFEYQNINIIHRPKLSPLINITKGGSTNFYQLLFMENTHIIYDAITELVNKIYQNTTYGVYDYRSIVKIIFKNLKEYYFENYRKLRNFQKYLLCNNLEYMISSLSINGGEWKRKKKIIRDEQKWATFENALHSKNEWDRDDYLLLSTTKLVYFRLLLQKDNTFQGVAAYYQELANSIKNVTNCRCVYIFGYGVSENVRKLYLISSSNGEKHIIQEDTFRSDINILERTKESPTFSHINDETTIINIYDLTFSNQNNKIYIYLSWNADTSFIAKEYAIRDILAFRNELLHRFNIDFINDAFQNFRTADAQKERALSFKVATHASSDLRNKICLSMDELLLSPKINSMDENELRRHAMLLQITADSLISELYVRYLQEKDIVGFITDAVDVEFNENLIKLFESIWSDRDKDDENDEDYHPTRIKINFQNKSPIKLNTFTTQIYENNQFYPLLFIVALLKNSLQHGFGPDKSQKCIPVNLTLDSEYLTIQNLSKPKSNRVIYKPDQITLIAIKYYYQNLTDKGVLSKNIEVFYEPIENSKNDYFTVKLPIIKKI